MFYEELEILGEGCVGLVKKCRSLKDDKFYAVKIVRTRDEETIFNVNRLFKYLFVYY